MAFGRGSTTVPSTSMASFFAKLPDFLSNTQKYAGSLPTRTQYTGPSAGTSTLRHRQEVGLSKARDQRLIERAGRILTPKQPARRGQVEALPVSNPERAEGGELLSGLDPLGDDDRAEV